MSRSSSTTSSSKRPVPPGKTAPTEPTEEVNEQDQERLLKTMPAQGFMLGRLIPLKDRAKHGFSPDSKAFQSAALLEVIRHHPDEAGEEFPPGSLIFASLEEVAPLLSTHLFLVPLVRVMGRLAAEDEELAKPAKRSVGFSS